MRRDRDDAVTDGATVREIRPGDAEAWTRLRHRLWPDHPTEGLEVVVRAFFEAGTPLVAAAFLAWDGATPAGFLELSLRPYVPGARSYPAPFVEGWYVEPRYRGRGVGRLLMEAAERWAAERGHARLGSDTPIDNAQSARAHEALGFREVEAVRFFVKDLSRGARDA